MGGHEGRDRRVGQGQRRAAADSVQQVADAASGTRNLALILLAGGLLAGAGRRDADHPLDQARPEPPRRRRRRHRPGRRRPGHPPDRNDELGDAGERVRRAWSTTCATSVASADRIAQGDLSTDVTPRAEQDALGHALHDMVAACAARSATSPARPPRSPPPRSRWPRTADETGRAIGEIAARHRRDRPGRRAPGPLRRPTRAIAVDEVSANVAESARTRPRDARRRRRGPRRSRRAGVAAAAEATERDARRCASPPAEVASAIQALGAKSDAIGGIVADDHRASPSRPTCWRSTPPSRPPAPASRAGLRGRGRGGPQAGRGVPGRAGSDLRPDRRDPARDRQRRRVVERTSERTAAGAATVEQARDAFERIGDVGRGHERPRRPHRRRSSSRSRPAPARVQDDIGAVTALAERSSAATEQVSASAAADLRVRAGDRRLGAVALRHRRRARAHRRALPPHPGVGPSALRLRAIRHPETPASVASCMMQLTMELAGTVALVTGANRGLGQGLRGGAARRGRGQGLRRRARSAHHHRPRLTPVQLDVTDPAQVARGRGGAHRRRPRHQQRRASRAPRTPLTPTSTTPAASMEVNYLGAAAGRAGVRAAADRRRARERAQRRLVPPAALPRTYAARRPPRGRSRTALREELTGHARGRRPRRLHRHRPRRARSRRTSKIPPSQVVDATLERSPPTRPRCSPTTSAARRRRRSLA